MASILVIGPDAALLEGISQTLIGAGHQVVTTPHVTTALDTLHGISPLVAVVQRSELGGGTGFPIPLASGGALISFDGDDGDYERLPYALKRITLAELQLPLERQRLLALIRNVETRAVASGREDSLPVRSNNLPKRA